MDKSTLLKRQISAGIVAGVKARRVPPETMADIPYAVRKAAVDYIKHIDLMRRTTARGSVAWQKLDKERTKLHDRFADACFDAVMPWMTDQQSEMVAFAIARRRWRADDFR